MSDSPYDSLNLGERTGDSPNRIRENRRLFFKAMSISYGETAVAQQVHGNRIVRIKNPGEYVGTDGLVTNTPGIILIVQVADCLPIYLYDPVHNAIGLIHAGWKGTVQEISSKAVKTMENHFNTYSGDLWVFFGPSIGPCCYEVGAEVSDNFSEKYINNAKLDLWKCNKDQFMNAGITSDHIIISRLCTVCHPEWFFSHRASGGNTGRMMAIFGLKDR